MNLALYFLTDILYILSFPNFTRHFIGGGIGFSYLAWFSLVPFIMAVDREKNVLSVGIRSFFCGWIIFLGGMYWLTEVTWLGYILLTLYMSMYIVIFGIIRFYNKNFFIVPLAWTCLEFIRGNLLGGMPWLILGSSQYTFIPLIQVANITGVYGISFLLTIFNAVMVKSAFLWKNWILVLCILFSVLAYGIYQEHKPVSNKGIKIALIQPDIPLSLKWNPDYRDWMVTRLIRLSEKTGRCGLLVWPETAVSDITEHPKMQKRLKDMVQEKGCHLITGSQGLDRKGSSYNSAFLISKKGGISEEYRKIHLVPFGEYMPLGPFSYLGKRYLPTAGDFEPGRGRGTISARGFRVGILICFESIFPDLSRKSVKEGANVLAVMTNDAWFGRTGAPFQHEAMSVFRAVETRRWVVRAANTGVSSIIDPWGRRIARTRIFEPASISAEARLLSHETPFVLLGDAGFFLLVLVLFVPIVVDFIFLKNRKKSENIKK